jgi:hypothetical protein
VGYIIGFPFDTPESVRRDIDRLKDDLKVDQASFFVLTPLPGSRDHYEMVQNGVYMDSDLNNFDSFHVVMHHPLMSAEEWVGAYDAAWASFYDLEHLKKVLVHAGSREYWGLFRNIMWYKNSLLEPRHPMVAGFIRRKHRTDIRTGIEPMKPGPFLRMRAGELGRGFVKRIELFFELQELWWVTRKPEDPKFKLIADFSTALSDARYRLSRIDYSQSCAKWRDEATSALQSLKVRMRELSDTTALRGGARRRFKGLVQDTTGFIEKINPPEFATRGITQMNVFMSQTIHQAEAFSLKNVARRRRITKFWEVTRDRLRDRRIFRFILSIPRIAVSATREFFMSLRFVYHMKRSNF